MSCLLVCHRRASGVSCAALAQHFRDERRELVRRHARALDHVEYRQLYQTSPLNPLYQGIKLTRHPALLALVPRTGAGPRPAAGGRASNGASDGVLGQQRGSSSSAGWDVVESFQFDSLQAMHGLLSPAARAGAAELVLDQQRWASATTVLVTDSIIGTTFERVPEVTTSTLFFLRAAAPLSRAEMLNYWGSQHKQLFLSKQSALGYGAYTQQHVRDDPALRELPQLWGDAGEAPFDGVASVAYSGSCRLALDFVSPRALCANYQLVADEVTFVDGRRSVLVFGAEERVN